MAFTPDGRRAVSSGGEKDQTVRVWYVPGGREVACLRGQNCALDVAVSPDGRFAALGGGDGVLRLWRLPDQEAPADDPGPPLARTLEGTISDVAVGGGGRYLLLTMKDAGKLAVFDSNTADVVKTIPLASPNALVAAGAKKFLVAFPDERVIQRWDLETLTREGVSAEMPFSGRLKGLALGSDSDGPALAAWSPDAGNNIAGPSRFSFIDLRSLKVLRVGPITTGGFQGIATSSSSGGSFTLHPFLSDQVHVRPSSGGGLFGLWQTRGSPSGFQTLTVQGKALRAVYNHESLGHLAPGPDGQTVYTGSSGRLDAEGKAIGRSVTSEAKPSETTIPSPDPSYYLTVESEPNPPRPVKVSVHVAGSGTRLLTVYDLDEMSGAVAGESGIKDDFTLEKRFHFLPAARLLITIPPTNDRLILRRLDVDQALDSLPGDYLFVVSPPSLTAKAGQPLVHQIEARSRKGSVKYTLTRGPNGLVVSPEGRLSWPSPRGVEGAELTAVVTVSDASGREVFHTLTLHVR